MAVKLLTASQVGKVLGVSESAVTRWAREGHVPYIRLPGKRGRYRFTQEMLDQILATGAPPSDTPEAAAS